jgi:transglutaminase-like putative cysteine protease
MYDRFIVFSPNHYGQAQGNHFPKSGIWLYKTTKNGGNRCHNANPCDRLPGNKQAPVSRQTRSYQCTGNPVTVEFNQPLVRMDNSMWLRTVCDLTFDIVTPTPFILMLRPRSGAQQWVAREEYKLRPGIPVVEFTDNYGNLCQRLIAPAGVFEIYTAANVMVADYVDQAPGAPFVEISQLPDNVLSYLLPSRFCESDRFGEMASDITAGQKPGYDQAKTIESWLRANILYQPGSSDIPESAVGVNLKQVGVCRDLSHLGIALCRSLSIPARLVVGYLYGLVPMDLHAWFEAYVGGRWYTFDATQSELHGGYVAIGYGRDATDVAIFNQFGPAVSVTRQTINVQMINEADS